MPEDKSTPEEKLLKLIENPAQAKGLKPKAQKIKFNISSFFSPKKFVAGIKQLLKTKDSLKPRIFNLKFANKSLLVLSFLVTAYLIFDFIKGRPNLERIYTYTQEGSARKIKTSLEIEALSISDFLEQIEKRDIFHFLPLKKEEKIPEAKEIFTALAANLKLVGIIWSKKPQAMIEDKKENRTILVNDGDFIDKIKIKQILRDKVIIGYEDQEMELL